MRERDLSLEREKRRKKRNVNINDKHTHTRASRTHWLITQQDNNGIVMKTMCVFDENGLRTVRTIAIVAVVGVSGCYLSPLCKHSNANTFFRWKFFCDWCIDFPLNLDMIQTNTVVVKIVWMSEWESECERGRDVMSEESEKKRKKQSSTHSSFNKNTNTIHNTFVKKKPATTNKYIFALSTWKFVIYSTQTPSMHNAKFTKKHYIAKNRWRICWIK